jgi:hypothetical protein
MEIKKSDGEAKKKQRRGNAKKSGNAWALAGFEIPMGSADPPFSNVCFLTGLEDASTFLHRKKVPVGKLRVEIYSFDWVKEK